MVLGAGAGGALAAQTDVLKPDYYPIQLNILEARGNSCLAKPNTFIDATFRYTAPNRSDVKLIILRDRNAGFELLVIALPTSPPAGQMQWRGPFTETSGSTRIINFGEMDGTFEVADLGVTMVKLHFRGNNCTETVDFFITP